jgi:hypothetical protein
MTERVSLAGPSESAAPAPRQPGAQPVASAVARRLLNLQWTSSNAAAQRMAPEIARRLSPAVRTPHRCAGGCTCGGSCSQLEDETDETLRAGVAVLQRAVAARRTIARDADQDPGPPELPDVKGFTCGIKDGKPFCTVSVGKGDALEIDPDSLSPDDRKAAFDPKRPKNCPPERWNWFWQSCCASGKHFDPAGKVCRPDATKKEQPFDIPPAPPVEKGDFPLPSDGQVYA